MATHQQTRIIDYLRKSVRYGGDHTDGQLLQAFLSHRDEAAFETLLRRHGSMVLQTCRRILRNAADAEDAFQATFLVLIRKSGSLLSRRTIGDWLYGVAHNTALKARAMNAKRRQKERQAAELLKNDCADGLIWAPRTD